MPVRLNSSGGGSVTLDVPATAGTFTATVPANTGTLVTDGATQTLTNKTLTSPTLTSPTLTSPTISGTPVMSASVLTLATAQNCASQTGIDFTGIPSWVRRITVMFSGVSFSANATPILRIGDSGGIETTGYASISGFTGSNATANALASTASFNFNQNWVPETAFHGAVVISLLNASTNTWVANGTLYAASNLDYSLIIAGSKSLSATLDRVQFTSTGGTTFDAGSINIMYE